MPNNDKRHWRDVLVDHFEISEIRTLCFNLGIHHQELQQDRLTTFAMELVNYCDRHNRFHDLTTEITKARPSISLPGGLANIDEGDHLPPMPYDDFVERQAVSEVVKLLTKKSPAVQVYGMGGNGKSSLVRHIVERIRDEEYDALRYKNRVWIEVRAETRTLDGVIVKILGKLGHDGWGDKLSQEKKQKFVSLLEEKNEEGVLIVLDDMEEIQDHETANWVCNHLPSRCKAIFISRQYLELDQAKSYSLRGMERPEALLFIRQQTNDLELTLTEEQTEEIFKVSGGNPYAIRIVLVWLNHGSEIFEQTIQDLKGCKKSEFFDKLFSKPWGILDEAARELFMLTTLFPDSVSRDALKILSAQDEDLLSHSLRTLLNLSLITKVKDAGDLRYNLHSLSRAFAHEQFIRRKAFAKAIRKPWLDWIISFLSSREWPWDDIRKLNEVKEEEPVAYAAIRWAAANKLHEETIALAKGLDHYYYVRGHWDKKAEIDQLRISAANAIEDFSEEAISISQYAQMLSTRGKQEDLKQVWQKHLPRLGELEGKHPLSLETIASIRHANAFYRIAQGEYDLALEILKGFQSQAETTTANYAIANQHWLAYCHYKCGQIEEAEKQFKSALEKASESQYLRSIAFCKRNLAEIALANKDYSHAEELIEDAHKRANEFNDRRYLAQCELVYARLYLSTGNVAQAKQVFGTAEERYKRLDLFTEMKERTDLREDIERVERENEALE
ncbi:MAG: hypothetical protein KC441_05870 [Anaerolineales bacterium]|nr:hypothetical protein [Anaerolineales bacterium]